MTIIIDAHLLLFDLEITEQFVQLPVAPAQWFQ